MVAEFVGDEVFTTARNKFEISYPKIHWHFFISIDSDWFFAATKGSSAGATSICSMMM